MNQKRFLTADEIFQLFGVDADALDKLVRSGAVEALKDRGNFRYRAEDFANLVNEGKLSPRTAGEMFEMDSSGDIPFLKIKSDDQPTRYDDGVSYIEIDEDALDEQAQRERPSETPVVPDKWFESDDSIETQAVSKTPEPTSPTVTHDRDKTDLDVDLAHSSEFQTITDSDVEAFNDASDTIDLDDPQLHAGASDSDVRLVGPVSQPVSPPAGAHSASNADSAIRLSHPAEIEVPSDSDVTIAPESSSEKPDSDSDVVLSGLPARDADQSSAEPMGSDSDVVLVAPTEAGGPGRRKKDSDSDVQLANTTPEIEAQPPVGAAAASSSESDVLTDFEIPAVENAGSSVLLGKSDSSIRYEGGSSLKLSLDDLSMLEDATPDDSGVKLESTSDSGLAFEPKSAISSIKRESEQTEFEMPVAADSGKSKDDEDSGITLETDEPDSGITLETKTDSEISIEDVDSGISLEAEGSDSGITLDSGKVDSGIGLDTAKTDNELAIDGIDSGLALEADEYGSSLHLGSVALDSGIKLSSDRTDSELAIDPDSGISLEDSSLDSGLSLQKVNSDSSNVLAGDSGIRLGSESGDSGLAIEGESSFKLGGDSGIRLGDVDSGIRLSEETEEEDGISLAGDADQPPTTMSDIEATQPMAKLGTDQTQDLHAVESGEFDTPNADSEHTVEMNFGDDLDDEVAESAATIINKGRKKSPSLSESFELDEPLEVEDLDISADLEEAVDEAEVEDFEEAEEEVLDASDDDFGDEEFEGEEASEDSLSEAAAPVAKARALPTEPSWGLLAVIPIGMASLAMAATVMVLWGGIATMWTGAEAPGPASALISALAGMWPS